MLPPIPLPEAQARLIGAVTLLPAEDLPVADAVGRYLAAPLSALRTQPPADLSAMDGYVVRRDDCGGPWTVVGESAAGHPFAGDLQAGQAIRISTGAHMPSGDGVVLLQENASRSSDALALNGEGDPTDRHVRRAGFDFTMGDTLLSSGERIGPAQLALAITGGHARLRVHRLPSVAIIDSGDELAATPSSCTGHQIPASNGAMLAAMCAPHVVAARRIGPVADTMDDLLSALDAAGDAEVIVTSGGASVGDHDLVRPALERWGAEIDFWRVAIRPGKPLLVARKGPQWIIGLPGNPVSSYVTAFLFVLPLLRRLAGAERPLPMAFSAPLGAPLFAVGDRTEFVRASFEGACLHPIPERDSSALRALGRAQALIERPAGAPAASTGDIVQAYLLESGGIA